MSRRGEVVLYAAVMIPAAVAGWFAGQWLGRRLGWEERR